MRITALGKVNVPSPGTPVPISTDPKARAAKLYVQVIPGLSGKAYIGTKNLNRVTLQEVTRVLWPNAGGGFSDSFLLESSNGYNTIVLSEYFIDMDVAGEGVLVTYWTA